MKPCLSRLLNRLDHPTEKKPKSADYKCCQQSNQMYGFFLLSVSKKSKLIESFISSSYITTDHYEKCCRVNMAEWFLGEWSSTQN